MDEFWKNRYAVLLGGKAYYREIFRKMKDEIYQRISSNISSNDRKETNDWLFCITTYAFSHENSTGKSIISGMDNFIMSMPQLYDDDVVKDDFYTYLVSLTTELNKVENYENKFFKRRKVKGLEKELGTLSYHKKIENPEEEDIDIDNITDDDINEIPDEEENEEDEEETETEGEMNNSILKEFNMKDNKRFFSSVDRGKGKRGKVYHANLSCVVEQLKMDIDFLIKKYNMKMNKNDLRKIFLIIKNEN